MLEIQLLRERIMLLERALRLVLESNDCWTGDRPEIAEELSARLDIGLDTAREIVSLYEKKNA